MEMSRRRQRGQAIVEFALIVPLLVTFAMSALDFGRLFYYDLQFQNALREGARYAARHSTSSTLSTDVQTVVQDEGNLPSGSLASVTVTKVTGSLGSETIEQVTGSYTFTFMTPWLQNTVGLANPLRVRSFAAAEACVCS
jgi:Flp pilus assembly protein TadG